MSLLFWNILLIILLGLALLIAVGIHFYHRIMNRIKNGLVLRIHMSDSTVKHYRYDEVPVDNLATVSETNLKGEEKTFVYTIKEECIEKGTWGRYIDYDYHVTIPINPKNRSSTPLLQELKELFKHIGALLDTDLHVKLLRNNKFENFVKMMLWILLIAVIIFGIINTVTMVKVMSTKGAKNSCVLTLDNSTWKTIYVATHNPPPQPMSS